jgi:hypothetical protein
MSEKVNNEGSIATVLLNTSDPNHPIVKNTASPIFDSDFGLVTCAEGSCLVEAKNLIAKGIKFPGQQGNINEMYVYHQLGEMPCEVCRKQLQVASTMMGPFRVWGGKEGEMQYVDIVDGVLYGPFYVANEGEKKSE